MNTTTENQENPSLDNENQEGSKKVKQRYDATVQKLAALVGGDAQTAVSRIPKKKPKVPNDKAVEIFNVVMGERTEKQEEELKKEVNQLLDDIITYEQGVDKARKDFDKAVDDERTKLADKADKVFQKVSNVETLRADYVRRLQQVTGPNP